MNLTQLRNIKQKANKIDEKIKKYEEGSTPITIDWDRKRILDFLLDQHQKGNVEATDLLYVQLYNDIRAFLDDAKITKVNDDTRQKIVACMQEFSEYPQNVITEMLRDFEEGSIELIVNTPQDDDGDDMPF